MRKKPKSITCNKIEIARINFVFSMITCASFFTIFTPIPRLFQDVKIYSVLIIIFILSAFFLNIAVLIEARHEKLKTTKDYFRLALTLAPLLLLGACAWFVILLVK
jgi:prolipoprotein diacylglyceryltransferase